MGKLGKRLYMDFEDVCLIDFIDNVDERGRLTAIEGEVTLPFPIKRVFYVHQVHDGVARGGHAHRDTDQVLTAVSGALDVLISNGMVHKKYCLDNPGKGLFVPHMMWVGMFNFTPGAICLVFASTKYDQSKSIRTWSQYLEDQGIPYIEEPKIYKSYDNN